MNTQSKSVVAIAVGICVVLAMFKGLSVQEANAQEFRKNNPQEVILGTRVDVMGNLQVIKP